MKRSSVGLIAVLMLAMAATAGAQNPSPKTFTPPRTPWGDPDLQGVWPMSEYACHEGNYAMRNILTGARADDAAKK